MKRPKGNIFSKYSQCSTCPRAKTKRGKVVRCRYYRSGVPSKIERGSVLCEYREQG